jgi:hypothetical protein
MALEIGLGGGTDIQSIPNSNIVLCSRVLVGRLFAPALFVLIGCLVLDIEI